MLYFRVVGTLKFTNGVERLEYDSWGSCDKISIESIKVLEHLYNLKYNNWYIEYKEE